MTDRLATVIVAVRCDVPEFAVKLNVTVPFPDPLLPAVIVTQLALSVACHVQPAVVETVTLLLPAAAPIDTVVGATVYEHVEVVPACVTFTA